MRRTIILYGVLMAGLIYLLKAIEYKFLVRDVSLEFYIGLIALLFTAVGIWAGLKITSRKTVVVKTVANPFVLDPSLLQKFGISKREHEVLELMAAGLSNQEIADKLFVSLNTVKTHSANLFLKLEVKRRTQAVQRGKDLQLIP